MAVFTPNGRGFAGREKLRDFPVGATKLDNSIHDGEYFHFRGDHTPRATTNADSTTGASASGAPTAATSAINRLIFDCAIGHCPSDYFIMGAGQTILAPVRHANGINVSLDAATTEGAMYTFGGNFAANPFRHVVGTTDDSFIRLKLYIEDASGTASLLVGWRKQETDAADFNDLNDLASVGNVSAATKVVTIQTNAATATSASLGTISDVQTVTWEVRITKAGKVSYFQDGVALNPSTGAYTATTALVMVPFLHVLHTGDVSEVYIVEASGGRMKAKDPLKAVTNN